ncbi:MAG: FAD-dependent oxidoreductase [Gaiellaceae bacterium]
MKPTVGIVGGGILGLTAAYRLARAGVQVSLYERSPDLGGLVGSFDFAGRRADRFYHVILPTDDRVRGLAEELGLGDRFRFRPTAVGFYDKGRLFSMSSLGEFARFPLLPPHDRLRLAAFVARCQLISSYEKLDDQPLEPWLRRLCGRRTVERLWRPLLDSKFDGRFDDLPATYLWARTRRMSKTRDSGGHEVMGWLEGGYQMLVDELARAIESLGGELHPGTAIEQIAGAPGGASGLVVGGSLRSFDSVLCTLVPAQARGLLAPDLREHAPADHCRYLGVVCLLLRLGRSVSPYYTLNITDRRIPLTTIVETTHVVDPDFAGGSLVYAAKYVEESHADLTRPAADVERDYLGHVRTIFPDLRDEEILASVVQRARAVEPVHTLGGAKRLPTMFPLPGLAMASTAHVYPELVNGQAVIGVADRVVAGLLERLPNERKAAA